MPIKVGSLIGKLAAKAGIDTTTDEWKDVLAITAEIDDTLAGNLDKGLLSIEAGKSNKDLRAFFRADILNGLDNRVNKLVEEYELELDDDFKNEKNSFEKVAKLTKLIKTTAEKKAGTTDKADKEGYEKQLAELHKELKATKKALTDKDEEHKVARDTDQTNFALNRKLIGKKYALPKEMDQDLVLDTANAAVAKELKSKGFKIIRNEANELKLVDKDGKPAYNDTHEAIEVDSFIDGTLARNKLLVVNDSSSQNEEGNNQRTVSIDTNGKELGNQKVFNEIDAEIAAFSKQ